MKFRDIYKLLKPYFSAIIIMILFSIFVSVVNIVTPFINSHMIDDGLVQKNVPVVVFCVFVLILLQIADNTVQYFQTKKELYVSNDLGKKLKVKALTHGLKLNPVYFKEQGFYKTIGDALYDIDSILSILSSNCMIVVMIIFKAIGATIGLFLLNWKLALLVMLLIPIKILFNIWVRNKAEQLGKLLRHAHKNYNAWFSDILTGIIDIKLWNLSSRKAAEYEGYVQDINESSKNLSLLTAKSTRIMRVIEVAFVTLFYLPGILFIKENQITLGSLVTFLSFSNYLLVPVDAIMDLRVTLKRIKPNAEGIERFFRLEEENYASTLLPEKTISEIEFKNISVQFDNRMVLKDICFTVQQGEKVAFVGDNGCGKTTLIRILLRLCDPYSGEVLLNGIPISEYNIEAYRQRFSVVSQEPHLFKGTVKENIILGEPACPILDKNIDFCTEAISKLDKQLETTVGSEGAKLSGGERQKVALLRALNRKNGILVLDEATSNYDMESENKFNLFVRENKDYDFYFIITHRKEILSCVDKIIYLSHGKITRIETKDAFL